MLISRYDTHHLGHSTDGSCTDSIFSSCFRRIIWNRPLGPSTAARCSSSRSCSRAVSSSVIPVPQTIKKRGGSGAPCCAAGCTRHRSAMRPTPRSGSAARSRPREPWPPWAFTPRGIRPALHRSGPGGMSANPAGRPDPMPAPWHSCTTNLLRTPATSGPTSACHISRTPGAKPLGRNQADQQDRLRCALGQGCLAVAARRGIAGEVGHRHHRGPARGLTGAEHLTLVQRLDVGQRDESEI